MSGRADLSHQRKKKELSILTLPRLFFQCHLSHTTLYSTTMAEANPQLSTVKTLYLLDSVFADAQMTENRFHEIFDEWWRRMRDGRAPARTSALDYIYTVRYEAAAALARLLSSYWPSVPDVSAAVHAKLQASPCLPQRCDVRPP